MDRILRRDVCRACRDAEREDLEHERSIFLGALTALDLSSTLTERELQILTESSPESMGIDWQRRFAASSIRFLLDQALSDERLTEAEERRIEDVARLLRLDLHALLREDRELSHRVTLARARDGRLPVVRQPAVALRHREVSHLEARAQLLEGASYGRQGGGLWAPKYVGFSDADFQRERGAIPKSAWMADDGVLIVTSRRVLFRGIRGAVEGPYAAVAGFTLFRNGFLLNMYDEHASAMFRSRDPHVVVGVASAAAKRFAERRRRKAARRR